MNILIVNHFPIAGSGSGVYVKNIALNFVKNGHKVCIIMPENTTNFPSLNGIKMHPVYFKREEQIKGQLDFNFPCMDLHPRSNFLFHDMTSIQIKEYENAFRIAIREEIKKFNPDIIHSQHIWIISGILKDYDIPYVITSHGSEFITYKRTDAFYEYAQNAALNCKKIITISKDNEEEIINYFPEAKDKLVYIKNGYNSDSFYNEKLIKKEILKDFCINKEFDKIVLFVGRVSKMKGLDTLFKSAQIYEKDNILTLIAGDGDYRTELENMVKELKLKNIVFLGNREDNDLRKLYNIANVFVLPSRKEALPLVAIEALACGTPVIVTDKFAEGIINKDVGLTFEMDNYEMLAEKIQMILNGDIVFDKNKITNYAKHNYSQEMATQKIIDTYKEALK